MKKIICVIICVTLLPLSLCSCEGIRLPKERFSATFYELFDTVSTVVAYDDSQAAFDEHMEQFKERLKEYDHLYDIYHSYDGIINLKTVNETAATAPVTVDRKIMDMLVFGKEVFTITQGNTDIAFGAVLQLWHDARDNTVLPDDNALTEAAKHTDINDLVLDEDAFTVFFADPLLQLDVGAVAKGYAVSEICSWAEKELWQSAVVSIGGNVMTIGTKQDGNAPWNIEIENPYREGDPSAEVVKVANRAVVTSAENQRYFTVDGKSYSHIINKDTLYPSEFVASVTVISADSAVADALSTALFNMPIDEGKALIESLDGVEALWQTAAHTTEESSGWGQYR